MKDTDIHLLFVVLLTVVWTLSFVTGFGDRLVYLIGGFLLGFDIYGLYFAETD